MRNPSAASAFASAALLVVLLGASTAEAQDEFPKFTIGGLLDARVIETDTTQSWLDGGLGKTRYGGVDGNQATLFRLSGASLLLGVSTSEILSAAAQVNFDAQPDNRSERQHVDLVTAYVSYRPELSPHWRLRVRAGILIPPVSLENDGPAWTATRTITPSAANSWVGEEVRSTGVEATFLWKGDQDDLSVTGCAFGGNDASGTLLAYRGWALGDRLSGFNDQLPLAPIPLIQSTGELPQAPWVQPFTEIDGKVGYYTAAAWHHAGVVQLNGIYYDNGGDAHTSDGFQYSWKTRFGNVGALVQLPYKIELLGQYMWGEARTGLYDGVYAVDAPFRATYGMLSVPAGRTRFSVRYDKFSVDNNGAQAQDSTAEQGSAWTGAFLVRVGEAHRFALEVLRVESDRPDRAVLGLPTHAAELQTQASFQFRF
jgi:hypothetical protein